MADALNWYENAPLVNSPTAAPVAPAAPAANWYEAAPLVSAPAAAQPAAASPVPATAQASQANWYEAAPLDAKQPSKYQVGAGDAAANSVASGLTFGYADEIAAGLDAAAKPLLGDLDKGSDAPTLAQRYDENVTKYRDILAAGRDQHPIISTAGEIAGGAIPAVLSGGTSTAATLGGKVVQGAATGAAYGAAYGSGNATGGITDRLTGAAEGALEGGAFGGVLPVAGAAIGAAAKKVIPSRFLPGNASDEAAQAVQQQPIPAPIAGAPGTAPISDALQSTGKTIVDAARATGRGQDQALGNLADSIAPDAGLVDDFAKLGIQNPTPADITGNQSIREFQGALTGLPGNPLSPIITENHQKLSDAANKLITDYGGSADKAGFSDAFRDHSLSTINDLKKESSGLYGKVAEAIPDTAEAPAENALALLRSKVANLNGDTSLLSAPEQKAYKFLTADPDVGKPLNTVAGLRLPDRHVPAASALSDQANNLVTDFGGSLDKARFSDAYKQQGLSTIDGLEQRSSAIYNELNKAIPKESPAAADSTVGYLNEKLQDLGGNINLLSPAERDTLKNLSPKFEDGAEVLPTYKALDVVRRQVGAGYKGRGVFADADSHDLDRLYASLSADQERAANAVSPEVGAMFQQAKGLVAQRKGVESALQANIGKDLSGSVANTLSSSVKKLATGDFQAFDKTLANVPDNMRQSAVMTAIGDAFSGGKGKGLDIPAFTSWYDSLSQNAAAKARIDSLIPADAVKRLGDLHAAARQVEDVATGRTADATLRTPTYGALDTVRRQLESKLRDTHFSDPENDSLRQLHGALLSDQQKIAEAHGVGQAFSAAWDFEAKGNQAKANLTDLIGERLDGAITAKLGSSVEQLRTGNFEQFDKIMSKIPPDIRQNAVITALASGFSKGSRTSQDITAKGFADWYGGLTKNAAAKERIFQYLPPNAQERLERIYRVAKAMSDASKSTIRTGASKGVLEDFDSPNGIVGRIMGVAKPFAIAEAAGHAVGIPGLGGAGAIISILRSPKTPIQQAAGELFASDALGNMLKSYSAAGGKVQANVLAREKQLVRTQAYKKWVSALSSPAKARIAAIGPLVYLTESNDKPTK